MSSDTDHWAAPLSNKDKLIIKIFAFGAAGLVCTILTGIIIYLVFFRKAHRERKAARKEEEAKNLENGILPKSKHYGIGKVPKKKYTPPPPPQKRHIKGLAAGPANGEKNDSPPAEHISRPSHHTRSPTKSSLSAKASRDRTPRVSWGSESTVEILPPPKAMTSEKMTENTTSH